MRFPIGSSPGKYCAAAQKRRLESLKIIAANHFKVGVQHVRWLRPWLLFAPKTRLPSAHERTIRTEGRLLHSGQHAHFIEQCLGEDVDLGAVVIFLPRQFETGREKRARLETQ